MDEKYYSLKLISKKTGISPMKLKRIIKNNGIPLKTIDGLLSISNKDINKLRVALKK